MLARLLGKTIAVCDKSPFVFLYKSVATKVQLVSWGIIKLSQCYYHLHTKDIR